MIGAILAGGYGKRLKPLTDSIPKALVEIRENYTIMDRQLFDFKNIGIKDVYILSGYLSEKIEERYKNYRDINLHFLREEKPMGTLYSISNLIKNINEDVIVRNGDTVSDINFKNFVEISKNKKYGMTMYITMMRSPYGIVEFSGDKVDSFREKPMLKYYINAGIYYIKPRIFDAFTRKYMDTEIEKTAFPYLVKNNEIGVYTENATWIGIDSEKDLNTIRAAYKGRDDTPFGYIKTIYSYENKKIFDYYIKAGESLNINIDSIIKINSGSGYMQSGDAFKYECGTVIPSRGNVRIDAFENTELEAII
ncbi:MAG: nucleotidyltransferase family protein [Ferroplasma sp.]